MITRTGILRASLGFFLCTMILLLLTSTLSAKMVFKLAHGDIDDPFLSPDHAAAVVFKSMVEAGTNGEIEVQIFPALVLGKERESMEMLKNGLIQIYFASVGAMGTFYPLIAVLDTPFAIPNFSVAYDVFDGGFGEKLKRSILEKTGIRCLEIQDANGFYNLTNNIRPIRSIEDVKGIKFRTMTLPSHINFFKSLGAAAIPISWAETYTSLQTGVVEGQHNPIGYIITGKVYEVQKHLTLSRHILATHYFLMNEDVFQSLSVEHRKIIMDAARTSNAASRGISRIVAATEKGLPFLKKHMEIYQPSEEEMQRFAEVCIPASKRFVEETLGEEGAALQSDYLKAIEESKKKLGY